MYSKLMTILFVVFLVNLVSNNKVNATEQAISEKVKPIGTLLVRITNFSSMDGFVRIAVFNSEETWLGTSVFSNVLKLDDKSCTDMTCEWTIEDTPYGEYGIAIYHDENGNEELDKYFFGLPKEDYGFSNNETIPPKWKNAKFDVYTASIEHTISLD